MANYSKQYCELCDPGFPWDFDYKQFLQEFKTKHKNNVN